MKLEIFRFSRSDQDIKYFLSVEGAQTRLVSFTSSSVKYVPLRQVGLID